MKIAVALSGGIDSAIAAYLLKREGHDIFAIFMKNWEEKEENNGLCTAEQDYDDVTQICEMLDIPYYGVNFSHLYWDRVFSKLLEGIKSGVTPNPDTLCNREIKFNALYKRALALGADYLATGHYCRTKEGRLLKGKDSTKDQSYFLYSIQGKVLTKVLFPVGNYTKSTIRQLAQEISLPVANKKESMGICFIGKRPFPDFLSRYLTQKTGAIENEKGHILGTHEGAIYYTIGQRKGLRIGGEGEPYFVIDKDIKRNVVIVVQGKNHPLLFANKLIANQLTWMEKPPIFPFSCLAKIRYRQTEQPCFVEYIEEDKLLVTFQNPQRAITPAQSIVFYYGEICLGGGIIQKALRSS